MNATIPSSCQCINCPGASCRCGCQHVEPSPAPAMAAGPSCACGPQCGCDAAEQGCLCSPQRA